MSIVPSQTELLYDLGLDETVIGITKFCVHPESWFRTKTRVGGTKNLNLDKIKTLQPDLIIANKEENDKHQVEVLSGQYPVWTSDISSLSEARKMILTIGNMTGTDSAAVELIQKIDTEYRVKEQIDHLVKRIEKHRMSGRKDISKADERAGILSDLQALFSEYNKARFIH